VSKRKDGAQKENRGLCPWKKGGSKTIIADVSRWVRKGEREEIGPLSISIGKKEGKNPKTSGVFDRGGSFSAL